MPKLKVGANLPSEEPDISAGPQFYDGPKPPAGIYKGKLKQCKLVTNSKGNPMFKVLVEIAETGAKAKFNGYGIWGNVNVQESTAMFVARFTAAIGATYADVVNDRLVGDNEDPPNVLKIGKVKLNGDNVVSVQARDNTNPNTSEVNLQVGSFLPPKDDDEDELDDEVEDDELEDDDADELVDASDDEDDEDDEDDDEEEDDDEDDEEELDEDELREELGELSRGQLTKRAREHGIRVTKSMSDDDIIDSIVETELNEPPF